MSTKISRRDVLRVGMAGVVGMGMGCAGQVEKGEGDRVAEETLEFVRRCGREDGGYGASPEVGYKGNSDTKASDLAAVTYAAVLAKTMGWKLDGVEKSIEFVKRHQREDGVFVNMAGSFDPKSDLAVLYNTTQGVVALRAMGQRPRVDPARVMDRFFVGEVYKKLPWYTTSFFPLFYAALGREFPKAYDQRLREWQISSQAEDGYLGDHVASTFHMAHYFRLVGEQTPRGQKMVKRIVESQKADGGFDIKEPDWDVHACFDAVFVLKQLGEGEAVRSAIEKAGDWAMRCRNADGGFGHYRGRASDMDAVYFQFGTLVMAGRVKGARLDLADGHTLSWGHAMKVGRVY
ncbi:MAG: terpene cyclase/mutase family protein [Planctomycetota bacterium]|nr:terpene cyclase/mutase family protein [Planctomycetota bacterium]